MVKPIMQGIKEGKMAFKSNVVDTALQYQSFNSGVSTNSDMICQMSPLFQIMLYKLP
jgi:hypothetical protein